MKVRLHESTLGEDEIQAAIGVLRSGELTMAGGGRYKQFERAFADSIGMDHGVTCNSGSSANLLAIAGLVAMGRLQRGDEVIVSALSWSTTVWPLVQYGLVPVIVDIDHVSLNMDAAEVAGAVTSKTRAVMPVHVYGNPCEMDALREICDRHSLILIEDCCEALGAKWRKAPVGTFGMVGTFSFYFSHHISTIEGGIVVTRDPELADMMRMQRSHGWTRECEQAMPTREGLDARFTFEEAGYNLRLTEVQSAIGLVQLPKLKDYVRSRRAAVHELKTALGDIGGIRFQGEHPENYSSWFGFTIITDGEKIKANSMRAHLEANGIETRPIICGNIARQPAMKKYPHRVSGSLARADDILHNAFSIGCHQDVRQEQIAHIVEVMRRLYA